jgi:hypothetical protein
MGLSCFGVLAISLSYVAKRVLAMTKAASPDIVRTADEISDLGSQWNRWSGFMHRSIAYRVSIGHSEWATPLIGP